MNTHTHPVVRAPAARFRPLCAALLLGGITPLAGCGDPIEYEATRPSIAVEESRCTSVELVGLRRADRLALAADGRLGLAGTRVDPDGFEAGRVFELDPRSGAARVFDSEAPREVALWIDGVLHTDGPTALQPADPDMTPWTPFMLPSGLPTDRLGEAPDAWLDGDTALVASNAHDALRPKAVLRLARSDVAEGDAMLESHYGTLGATLGDDWIDATPSVRSFVPGPDDRVYAVGRARAASVDDADLRPTDRPRTYVGFVSVARETRPEVSLDAISLDADEHTVRAWHQSDFWPMRVVTDHAGRPTVLYITGHSGKRIEQGWPHMARLSPAGELVDPRPLPLPDFAEHGGVQAAVPLRDGGWLIGGSACRPGRSLCKAFVSRIDRAGDVMWTEYVMRAAANTVVDLQRAGDRIYALGVSSPYCCEYDTYRNGGWLVELMDDGACPETLTLPPDGRWLR